MTASCREGIAITGRALLALGVLGLLIWGLLHQSVVVPRLKKQVSIVSIVQPPRVALPPPRLIPPPKVIPPPPIAKVVRAAASRPSESALQPKAQPSGPKFPMPAQRNALALDTPLAPDPFEIPQGIDTGNVMGGGGSGGHGLTIGGGGAGGGRECGHLYALEYLEKVNGEVVRRFREDPAINTHTFIARVRLWFDPTGGVRRTEFESSTGNSSLDEVVAALLRTIDMKEKVPECIQPITVQVVSPWNAQSGKAGDGHSKPDTQSSQTLIWQRPPAR